MANFYDYIQWRGDITFKMNPLNEVDALILCQLAYINIDGLVLPDFTKKGITLYELNQHFINSSDYTQRRNLGAMINPLSIKLLQAAADSKRFGSLRLCGYENIVDKRRDEQFSALTFVLGDGTLLITYRGTDDTIVGWKEDFDLGWKEKVPSQIDALTYLESAAKKLSGRIIIAGHSKGGNLAMYAAVNASDKFKKRIATVFNYDGPGLNADFFKSKNYRSIAGRIRKFVPQYSIVGMLFCHVKKFTVVESDQKGLQQHDPFSWKVNVTHFVELSDVDEKSKVITNAINGWFDELDTKQKELFVETVFDVLKQTKATTNSELTANLGENILKILKAMTQLDTKTREAVFKTIQILIKCARESFVSERNTRKK